MKIISISISDIREHGSISAAIEGKAAKSDDIASGVIGPSFACSGPGSGWQCNYDVSDYAMRALDDSYGATYYIDSADGREATLDEDGDLEWSDESVVEIELPSVEEALAAPDAARSLLDGAAAYGADEDEIAELRDKIANPYEISDGIATEYAESLDQAAAIIEDWYDYLLSDGVLTDLPSPDICADSIDDINESIKKWEDEIAEAMGKKDFAGHGSYFVSARDASGLRLRVEVRE